jgi:hypothetical protein
MQGRYGGGAPVEGVGRNEVRPEGETSPFYPLPPVRWVPGEGPVTQKGRRGPVMGDPKGSPWLCSVRA